MSNFESDEMKLCKEVLGLYEREAFREIWDKDCIPFVVQRDKQECDYPNKCAHSYRVNLILHKSKVVSAFLG